MHRNTRLTEFALVLCFLCLSGPAAAGESPPFAQPVKPVPPVVHGYCYADSPTVYFSTAFSSPPVGGPGGTTHQETLRILSNTSTAWREAFEAYLKETYGPIGLTQCAMEDSLAKAQAAREALLDHFRRSNAGYTIKRSFVETDWAYAAPEAAPAAVASTVPEAAPKSWQCWSSGFGGSYITPGFESARDYNTLNADWRAYITQLHPPTGATQIRCVEIDPRQAANNLAQAGRKRVDWQE